MPDSAPYPRRKLPVVLPPATGESFPGYLDRLAHALYASLDAVLLASGLSDAATPGRRTKVPGNYGVSLEGERLERFCYATDLPPETVAGMHLASYGGVCGDFSAVASNPSSAARSPYERPWAYLTGSHACPACLAEEPGVWKLGWRLPWSFACVRHRLLLVSTCSGCKARFRTGRIENRGRPVHTAWVPQPELCMNPGRGGSGSCGYPLADIKARSLEGWPHVLRVQERLDRILEGERQPLRVAGEDAMPLGYFDTLRALAALILTHGAASDLGDAPSFAQAAFEQVKQQGIRRTGALARAFGMPPEDATALCAVIPAAVAMVDARTVGKLAESLEPLAGRTILEDIEATAAYHLLTTASGSFAEAFERARGKQLKPALALLRWDREAVAGSASYRHLSPNHVPQLLWEDVYDELFAEFFAHKERRMARRVCSMSVVRSMGIHSWREIEKRLELPVESRITAARFVRRLQSQQGTLDGFASNVEEVISRLEQTPPDERIDYKQRRWMLVDLKVVPYADWARICGSVRIGAGKDGVRNRCAAAWIWCHIAGGDYATSPAFTEKHNFDNMRVHYHRFEKECAGDLEHLLTEYGMALVEQPDLR